MAALNIFKCSNTSQQYIFRKTKGSLFSLSNYVCNHYNIKHNSNLLQSPPVEDPIKIKIPKRIPRGPTDILKALSSTVKRNPASPHYKYEDDPYFLPISNVNKRSFALSKEAGRKAAAFLLEKYPDSFEHNPAEPNIPAFNARIKNDESNLNDPQSLKECIDSLDLSTSVTIYKYLKTKDVALDDDVLHSLLELLCYYGGEIQIPEDYIEERWLKRSEREQWKKWQPDNLIDEIFVRIENKTARSYSALIKGLAKHKQIDRAYTLFKEMKDKNFAGDVDLYNELLMIVPFLREGADNRWNLVEELVSDMAQDNLKPNIGTFNALLANVNKLGTWRNSKDLALSIFAEMKQCGVEPSLASYYYLLGIFCKDRGPTSYILIDIINEIGKKEFEIRHKTDINFFVTAMEICNNHLGDAELALKVNDLYQYGGNSKLIGSALKESIYYQNLFKAACKLDDIDNFFQLYNKYVPHSYTPEPSVMIEILEAINSSGKLDYIPQMWSDAIMFNHSNKENVVSAILAIMAQSKDEHLVTTFATVAQNVKERILAIQDKERIIRTNVTWTGQILGDLLTIFTKASDLEESWDTFKIMNNLQGSIMGFPSNSSLQAYCKLAILNEQYDRTLACLNYASDIGQVEVIASVNNMCQNMDIKNENFKTEVKKLLPELKDDNL